MRAPCVVSAMPLRCTLDALCGQCGGKALRITRVDSRDGLLTFRTTPPNRSVLMYMPDLCQEFAAEVHIGPTGGRGQLGFNKTHCIAEY